MRIRQNFLATDKDWATLHTGLRLVREVASQARYARLSRARLRQGPAKSRTRRSTSGRHSDNAAVVDGQLRIFGIDELRVVDASVMPDLVGGNINAPVIMIAERPPI
jgi:choline dehydrogenase-like flavoprotein